MSGQPEPEDNELSSEETASEASESAQQTDAAAEAEAGSDDASEDDPLQVMQARADENWEKYVRAAAELENTRKRALRDVENAHKYSLERFARELLGVRDSLEMGIEAGVQSGAEALLEGSKATLKLLETMMQQFGIAELDPHGEPFDPELHEAMTTQPCSDVEPGSVMTVFQKGYTLNDRLLRPARVVVAQEPSENNESD